MTSLPAAILYTCPRHRTIVTTQALTVCPLPECKHALNRIALAKVKPLTRRLVESYKRNRKRKQTNAP